MPSYFFLIWVLLIGAMFYFMMVKPQKRARAQQFDLLQHLAPGSEVRTNAQIMGTVTEVGDDYVVIESTPGTKIKIGKAAIVGIVLPDDDEAEAMPGGIGDAPAGSADEALIEDSQVPVRDAVPADVQAEAPSETKAEDVEHVSKP